MEYASSAPTSPPATPIAVYEYLRQFLTYLEMIDGVLYPQQEAAIFAFKALPAGVRAELKNGIIHLAPFLSEYEKVLADTYAATIFSVLEKELSSGVYFDRIILLDEATGTIPTGAVILSGNPTSLGRDGCLHGVPDIVIDFLPADIPMNFFDAKTTSYQQARVQEYFAIDPETKRVRHFVLNNSAYDLAREETAVLHSGLLGADVRF